jgi:stage II sporulation protein P
MTVRGGRLRRVAMAAALALTLAFVPAPRALAEAAAGPPDEEHNRTSTLVSADGRRLLVTGWPIHPGDRFIDAGNDIWQVWRVEGMTAVARLVAKLARTLSPEELEQIRRPPFNQAALGGSGDRADVVIYHSHSDESYIPGDGTESTRGKGGIYAVGAGLAAGLHQAGMSVVQRPENHNPHDNGSYIRSRRTAMDALMKHQPAAVFDVHRDAAPGQEYAFTVEGRPVSRVMIVIGGANPTHEANLAFARLIKEKADERYPGLVRGIYVGVGNYNQDTYSRNILLEVGSQETPRAEAEAGAALMGAAIAPALQEAGVAGSPFARAENRAAWRTIGSLLAALLLLGGGALVLMSGGVRPARDRLAHWQQELWDRRKRR